MGAHIHLPLSTALGGNGHGLHLIRTARATVLQRCIAPPRTLPHRIQGLTRHKFPQERHRHHAAIAGLTVPKVAKRVLRTLELGPTLWAI